MKSALNFWRLVPMLVALTGVSAAAQDSTIVRSLAATCFTCHGTDGKSVGGVPPSLAGRSRTYLLRTLKDFKTGKRSATIMQQHAKGYTDEQLELIAEYFASVEPNPAAAPPGR